MNALVISHANCTDGAFAAWTADFFLQQAGYTVEIAFAEPDRKPPTKKATYDIVFVLDMVLPQDVLETLGPRVFVLDHHKTNAGKVVVSPRVSVCFDMECSGAGLAWDLIPGILDLHPYPRPWFINYVEDRDLWKWALPASKEINAMISFLGGSDPGRIADIISRNPQDLSSVGAVVLQVTDKTVNDIIQNAYDMEIRGVPCIVVNAPTMRSEVGDILTRMHSKLAVVWWSRGSRVFLSFRGPGASDLAESFGGGGHPRAAGASMSMAQWTKILDPGGE